MPRLTPSLALLVLSVSSIGCGKTTAPTDNQPAASAAPTQSAPTQAASAEATAAATPPPPKPAGFDARGTLGDGKAIEYRSAIAFQYKNSSVLRLQLSTLARACADVDNQAVAAGEDRVEIALSKILKAEGGTAWTVMQAFHSTKKTTASGALGKYADARLVGEDPTKEVRVTLSGWSTDRIDVKVDGTVVAEGCGVVPGPDDRPDAVPPAHPQKGLSLEVAGQKLEVKGAIYWADRDVLTLSTHPLDCGGVGSWEPEVTLRLSSEGKRGAFSGFRVQVVDDADLSRPAKLQIGKKAGDTVPAKLDGDFKLGPYAVKLKGTASLLACN